MTFYKMGEVKMNLQTEHCQLIEKNNEEKFVLNHGQILSLEKDKKTWEINFKWEIVKKEGNQNLGSVQLKSLPDLMTVEIYYQHEETLMEMNLMEELLSVSIDYVFNVLNIPRVLITVRSIEFELIQLLKSFGMKLDEKIMIGGGVFSKYVMTNPSTQSNQTLKMRSSHCVYEQVLRFAKCEEGIRILMQTGLRLNRDAPVDILRDYHYRLGVRDNSFKLYIEKTSWMNDFGELLVVKKTKISDFIYLFQMQFQDGLRLDFEFISLKESREALFSETLCRIILDKDQLLPPIAHSSSRNQCVKQPTEEEFQAVLNDIWWNQIEVAKALYREEVTLVGSLYETLLTEGVTKLLSWKVAMKHEWKIDLGRKNRWLKRYLPDTIYQEYLLLYPTKSYGGIWDCLFNMKPFVERQAREIAVFLGYVYDVEQGERVSKFLHRINSLPDNASEFH